MGRRQRRLRIPAESDEDKGMGIRPPTDHEGYARVSGGNAPWLRDTLGGLSIAPLNLGPRDRAPNARARRPVLPHPRAVGASGETLVSRRSRAIGRGIA